MHVASLYPSPLALATDGYSTRTIMSSPLKNKHEHHNAGATMLLLHMLVRLVNALLLRTFFNPDEYWQGPEVGYKIAFGQGHL